MIDARRLDDLAHRLAQAMPPGLRGLRDELEQNFRSILHSNLERLDLVSREQFEVQQALLERTRAKLDRLERRMAEMEKQAPAPAASKKATASRSGQGRKTASQRKKPDNGA